jgi:hypothetical protein
MGNVRTARRSSDHPLVHMTTIAATGLFFKIYRNRLAISRLA